MRNDYKYKFKHIVVGITIGLVVISFVTLIYNFIGMIFGGDKISFDIAYPIILIPLIWFFAVKIKDNIIVSIDEDSIVQYTTKIQFSEIVSIKEVKKFFLEIILVNSKKESNKIMIFMPKSFTDYDSFRLDLARIKQSIAQSENNIQK